MDKAAADAQCRLVAVEVPEVLHELTTALHCTASRQGVSLQMQPGQEVFPEGQSRGRITIYCIAETLNRDLLSKKLRDRGPNFQLQVQICCMHHREQTTLLH